MPKRRAWKYRGAGGPVMVRNCRICKGNHEYGVCSARLD
jgi:hypothetical protein